MPVQEDVLNDALDALIDRIRATCPGVEPRGQIHCLGDTFMIELTLRHGMVGASVYQSVESETLDEEDREVVRDRCNDAMAILDSQARSIIQTWLKVDPRGEDKEG